MGDKIVDVNYTELDDREYFTIEEASEKINVEIGTIIFWCNKFDGILKINSIGQFKIFSREDIRNLITIKELNLEKGMSISEIKQYLKHNDSAIVVRKDNEIDLSIFNFFSNIINTQNQKIDKLLEVQNQSLQMFSKVYNEMCVDSLEKDKLLNQILENQQQTQQDISAKIESYVTNIEESILKTNEDRDIKMINTLQEHLRERRLETEQLEKEKSKGLFSKIFKR